MTSKLHLFISAPASVILPEDDDMTVASAKKKEHIACVGMATSKKKKETVNKDRKVQKKKALSLGLIIHLSEIRVSERDGNVPKWPVGYKKSKWTLGYVVLFGIVAEGFCARIEMGS